VRPSVAFSVLRKDATEVRPNDVMSFVTRSVVPNPGVENVVRIVDGLRVSRRRQFDRLDDAIDAFVSDHELG
jgi:hypothetical protein